MNDFMNTFVKGFFIGFIARLFLPILVIVTIVMVIAGSPVGSAIGIVFNVGYSAFMWLVTIFLAAIVATIAVGINTFVMAFGYGQPASDKKTGARIRAGIAGLIIPAILLWVTHSSTWQDFAFAGGYWLICCIALAMLHKDTKKQPTNA